MQPFFGLPPNQSNIKYIVELHTSIQEFVQKPIDDVKLKQVNIYAIVGACRIVLLFGTIKK